MLSRDICYQTIGSMCDLLESAPCPPPTMTFTEFREHVFNRKLNLKEICLIAKTCKFKDQEVGYDCFQGSETTAAATTEHLFTTSTVPITEQAHTRTTKLGSTNLAVIIVVLSFIVLIIIFISKVCQCQRNAKLVESLIQCAPCPPPVLSYMYFREYALNNSLCQEEVCSIARRCLTPVREIESDCPTELAKDKINSTGILTIVLAVSCVFLIPIVIRVLLNLCQRRKGSKNKSCSFTFSCLYQGTEKTEKTSDEPKALTLIHEETPAKLVPSPLIHKKQILSPLIHKEKISTVEEETATEPVLSPLIHKEQIITVGEETATEPVLSPLIHKEQITTVEEETAAEPVLSPLIHKEQISTFEEETATEPVLSPLIHKEQIITVEEETATEPVLSPLIHKEQITTVEEETAAEPVLSPLIHKEKISAVEEETATEPALSPLIHKEKISTVEEETPAKLVPSPLIHKEQISTVEEETAAELVPLTFIDEERTSTFEEETATEPVLSPLIHKEKISTVEEETASEPLYKEETDQTSPEHESSSLTVNNSIVRIEGDNKSVSESQNMLASTKSLQEDTEIYYSANESDSEKSDDFMESYF